MTKKCSPLPDGEYEGIIADITIKNGKAEVSLRTSFGLPVGSEIPLKNTEEAVITIQNSENGIIFNGHSII